MKKTLIVMLMATASFTISTAHAGVVSSSDVLSQQQVSYTKSQVLSYVDSAEVQSKLVSLGVDSEFAKARINSLTNAELAEFNTQINDAPAGGIVGTAVTVFIVLAILDLVGVTDIFPFINKI